MTHDERRERRRQIAEAIRSGSTVAAAMARFGVVRTWVHESCREHGVAVAENEARAAGRAARRAAIVAAIRSGDAAKRVARRFGLSASRVSKICREEGVPLPGAGPSFEVKLAILAGLFDPTLTTTALGRKHGVAQSTVSLLYRTARRAGLPLPARSQAGERAKANASA
jgi:transposase-like protein